MISQTSYIAAFLFIGFIVFITVKGELPQYKAAIFGGSSGVTTAQNSSNVGPGFPSAPGSTVGLGAS
jgi:hypothetical protein